MFSRSNSIFTIMIDNTCWRVGARVRDEIKIHEFDFDVSYEEHVDLILAEFGRPMRRCEIVLGIPSTWCVAIPIDLSNCGGKQSAKSLLYEIEKYIPLNAEDIVADFTLKDKRAVGVASKLEKVKTIVSVLENAGFVVSVITPSSFLALEACRDRYDNLDKGLWIGDNGHWVDAICFSGKHIQMWQGCKVETKCFQDHANVWKSSFDKYGCLISTVVAPEIHGRVAGAFPEHKVVQEAGGVEDYYTDVARQALKVLRGRRTASINLGRDSRVGKWKQRRLQVALATFFVSFMLLISSVAGAAWVRASEISRMRDAVLVQQTDLYRGVYPGEPVPGAILSRLRSEASALKAVSGRGGSMPQFDCAFSLLISNLDLVPTSIRFRVLDIQVSPRSLRLDGQAINHRGPELLAEALKMQGHYSISPPRTQSLRSGGVSFTIHGTFSSEISP